MSYPTRSSLVTTRARSFPVPASYCLPVSLEVGLVQHVHPPSQDEGSGGQPEPVAIRTLLLPAPPEPQVQVVLVGALILGEADVAVDPHHGCPDLRHRLGIGGEPAKEWPDRLDEGHGGLEQVLLIVVVVVLEPFLGVVAPEILEERRRHAETFEGHGATLRRPADTVARILRRTTAYGGVLVSTRTDTVWVKRAVIPDVT